MKFSLILAAILIALPSVIYADEAVVIFTDQTIDILFNKPKGAVASFTVEKSLKLSTGNYTSNVAGLRAYVTNISDLTVALNETSLSLERYSSKTVRINFTVPSTMGEGTYRGILSITDTDVSSYTTALTLNIVYPNATLITTWDQNLGSVRAGTTFTRVLNISELMGYKSASDVSVELLELGPADFNYTGFLGEIPGFGSRNMNITVNVPERYLIPDTYPITTLIKSTSNISVNASAANYTIPPPVMAVSEASLDLGKITFEPGKDASEKTLIVKETGDYTPIEGLKISLTSGEAGWISYSEGDYISRGSSKDYAFKIYLPPDAKIEKKNWVFRITTDYAGSKDIPAKVIVYFPGIEEALSYLRGKGQVGGHAEATSLIENSISLLEKLKGVTETKKIAMAMSVYTGARAFITNLEEAVQGQNEGNANKVGDAAIRAKTALNRMKIGNENLGDKELNVYSNVSVASAAKIWLSTAQSALTLLSEKAEASKDSNYKFTALYYRRMGKLYALLGDSGRAEEYSKKQKSMEELYTATINSAINDKNEAEKELDSARESMLHIGGSYFVLNPFAFDFVMSKYDSSIKRYFNAERLYRNAGESGDADLARDIGGAAAKQRDSIYRSFLVYGIFLVALFVGFLIRASIGFQNFKRDEEDGKIGEIILKSEARV